jgi:hypothetical protein
MKTLKHLRIVVVCGAKKLNGIDIVDKRMEFGNVEGRVAFNFDKETLVLVEKV